jgi:IS30 family transposase
MRLKSRLLRFEVEHHLGLGWTPELISGRFRKYRPELPRISPEAIYQWIYREAPHWIGTLPRSHVKRRKRQFPRKGKKVIIPRRTSITERPACVQQRQEPGHWESDLLIGRGRSALQNNTERVSRFAKIAKVADQTAAKARQAIAQALKPLPAHLRRSLTYDNGTENAEHHLLNREIGTRSFFCEPYHSWEKGTVENKNGVIRRFFPKKTNFDMIPDDEIRRVEDTINNRPMKCLDFKTPAEVFASLVALTG